MSDISRKQLSSIDDVIAEILDNAVEEFVDKLGLELTVVEQMANHTILLHFKEGVVIKLDLQASLE